MTRRRAAPGPQLGAGRLRVDAARAIAKLREYQLADRTAWILEAIRAAVAAGANAIELSGDSNDVWLAWHGPPIAAEDLPRLFDELVSPEAADDRHHLRLLAAGVNSGLGLPPAFIDVIAVDATGDALRARYTPDVLGDPDADAETIAAAAAQPMLDDAPLRRMVVEPCAPPRQLAGAGMVVHLRRRVSLEVLGLFVRGGEPPELAIARAACADIAVPLTIGGAVLDRNHATTDVVRVPLGDGLDGWLAIVEPLTSAGDPLGPVVDAKMVVAERGVVLATYALDLGVGQTRGPLPVRLFIDARRMPTNASRSEVRRDRHPIAAALHNARALLATLFDALAAQLAAPEPPARARAAALTVLAAAIAGPDWHSAATLLRGPMRTLADLPLLRDATGTSRLVAGAWSGVVHASKRALDADLEPWLRDVLWVPPGDAAERLLAGASRDPRAMRSRARWARRQRRAHRRFFDHGARAATVIAPVAPRVRMRLGAAVDGSCITADQFAELTGEICVFAERATSELVLMLDGRELERIELDSPIPFAAVIDSKALSPGDRYRGAHRDREFAGCERALKCGLVRAVEGLLGAVVTGALPAGFSTTIPLAIDRERDAVLARAAIALTRELHVQARPPLTTTLAWRALGGEWLSFSGLAGLDVIGIVPPDHEMRAIGGRVVVVADDVERTMIARARPSAAIVNYASGQATRAEPIALATRMLMPGAVALARHDGDLVGAIAWSATGAAAVVSLRRVGRGAAVCPAVRAVHDRRRRRCARAGPGVERDRRRWRRAGARLRDVGWRAAPRDREHADRRTSRGPPRASHDRADGRVRRRTVPRARDDDAGRALGDELATRLRAHPLVRVHGEYFELSIDEIAARFTGAIPYVDGVAPPVQGYAPIIADKAAAHAIGELAAKPVIDGTAELPRRRAAAVREQRLAALRAVPPHPPAIPYGERDRAGHRRARARPRRRGARRVRAARLRREPPVSRVRAPRRAAADRRDRSRHQPDRRRVRHHPRRDDRRDHRRGSRVRTRARDRDRAPTAGDARRSGADADAAARAARAADPRARRDLRGAGVRDGGGRTRCRSTPPPPMARSRSPTGTARGSTPAPTPRPRTTASVLLVRRDDDELRELIALRRAAVVDVTTEVDALQAQRRVARGLQPRPQVHGVAADLKRTLAELGDAGAAFGVGEVGLIGLDASFVQLYERGMARGTRPLDVAPAIQLAVEASVIGRADDAGDAMALGVRAQASWSPRSSARSSPPGAPTRCRPPCA